jgi:lysyl-tRNA synthetase class 2
MGQRIMGKASFAEIQDESGRIQLYINRDELCPGEDKTLTTTFSKSFSTLGISLG